MKVLRFPAHGLAVLSKGTLLLLQAAVPPLKLPACLFFYLNLLTDLSRRFSRPGRRFFGRGGLSCRFFDRILIGFDFYLRRLCYNLWNRRFRAILPIRVPEQKVSLQKPFDLQQKVPASLVCVVTPSSSSTGRLKRLSKFVKKPGRAGLSAETAS